MLQALTETGACITPAMMDKQEIASIRLRRRFFCPECKESVILRAGEKVIPHFAHRQASNCSRKGGESPYHMQGKLQLYQWLKRQYQKVYLEKYIPTIEQRPDILVIIDHRTVAIEFQCAVIDPRILRKRSQGYRKKGITPIWLLGANGFNRIGKQTIKLNSFTIESLQKFTPNTSSHILYYCPQTHKFFKASDLYMTNTYTTVAHLASYNAHHTTFPQLVKSNFMNKRNLYQAWLYEKKRLRLGHGKLYGKELKWRHWLYERGYYIHELPAIVHLPIASQYKMNAPLWHWQSHFILDFLHPLPVNDYFDLQELHLFLKPYQKQIRATPLIQTTEDAANDYLRLLIVLGYIQEPAPTLFQKMRSIPFPTHIEEALQADKILLQRLLEAEQQADG